MAQDSGVGDFLVGLILGGLVGAAVALLFAPQSGEQTQAMIREKGIELRDRVQELSPEEAKKAINDVLEQGRQAAERIRQQMLANIEQLRKQAQTEEPPSEITISG
jgi:gas vesicle protein